MDDLKANVAVVPDVSPFRSRLLWAGVFISGLVISDLLLKLLCSAWPLMMYLVFGAVGAVVGPRLHRRFSGDAHGATFIRHGAHVLARLSIVGMVVLFVMPISWETKCAWRYCDRAFGPSLFNSPFPVGTPTCRGWNKCANEYPYTRAEYAVVLQRIRQQGCAEP